MVRSKACGAGSAQLADTDVAECQRARMIALQPDVAAPRAAVVRPRGELARLHASGPVRAAKFVFEQLDAVQPVFDMWAPGDNLRRVPLADRFEVARRRRVHRIRGAGAREPRLVVGAVDVVE